MSFFDNYCVAGSLYICSHFVVDVLYRLLKCGHRFLGPSIICRTLICMEALSAPQLSTRMR